MDEGQTKALATSLRQEHARNMVDAEKRQKAIAKTNQEDHRSVEGLGRPVASFDAAGYQDLKVRQGVGALTSDLAARVEPKEVNGGGRRQAAAARPVRPSSEAGLVAATLLLHNPSLPAPIMADGKVKGKSFLGFDLLWSCVCRVEARV